MNTETLNGGGAIAPSMDDRLRIAREAGRRWAKIPFAPVWPTFRIEGIANAPPSDEEMAVFWAKIAGAVGEGRTPIERRRVTSGLIELPKHIVGEFPQSGTGILKIVTLACGLDCQCWVRLRDLSEHVGCSLVVVRNELRKAEHLGFIEVRHPHRGAAPDSPTKVRVVDPEWCARIAERRPRKAWK